MTVACSGGNCFARALRACAVALAATALVACHGRNIPPPGTVVLTLGDTSGDFPSYQVTLDSIVLTQADGTQAAVWLTPELVDLAKLTDFSELVGAPAVTSGTYTSATLTVDYTAAAIYFNKAGHAQLCNAVGPTGAALLVQTLTINFDPANPLVITAGKSTRAALDFDLAASNSVNTAVTPCVATVHPFATMRPAPVDGTVLRSRGLLVLTQPSSNDFIMNTRPLFDLVSIGFGALTVNITPQTYFNVNGVTYTGVDGLDGIQVQGINVPIAAYGTLGDLSGITPTFNATSVYAGTSLESPLEDHIQGVIASRTGNSIVVEGAFLLERTGIAQFADTATVTVGSNTVVSQDGVAATGLSTASLSVGQQLDIGGQATLSTAGALSMDATAGQVRMTPTQIFGTLNSATPGTASLAAETFGSFAFTDFNFSGTNVGGASANPADYILNTGSMDLSATAPGTLLQVNGFVTPFGTAPPNFNATVHGRRHRDPAEAGDRVAGGCHGALHQQQCRRPGREPQQHRSGRRALHPHRPAGARPQVAPGKSADHHHRGRPDQPAACDRQRDPEHPHHHVQHRCRLRHGDRDDLQRHQQAVSPGGRRSVQQRDQHLRRLGHHPGNGVARRGRHAVRSRHALATTRLPRPQPGAGAQHR